MRVTGAELLARQESEPPGPSFAVGMMVRHPRYGTGKVLSVSGAGRRQTVSVRFETGDREETFVAARSPLR